MMGGFMRVETASRRSRRPLRAAAIVVGWLATLAGGLAAYALAAQTATESAADQVADAASDQAPIPSTELPEPAAADDSGSAPLPRLREGTQLTDRLGRFRQDSESLTFIDEGGREFGGLPNLGLERIIRALKGVEEPESVWWSVSGMVTEFSGRNYLLVSRAVYKAATLPPTPESVGE